MNKLARRNERIKGENYCVGGCERTAGMASSVLKELDDLCRLEKQINEALQAGVSPNPISLASLPTPTTHLAEAAAGYAKSRLDWEVFQHSMRTYYLGAAIATLNFPELGWDAETTYVAAMLHDLGLSSQAFRQSALSFNFHGGLLARDFLVEQGASPGLTDTVVEAIFRHLDKVWESYGHSPDCLLLIFGSHLDAYGAFGSLIHPDTIREVVTTFPRHNFLKVFPDLVEEEMRVKPFCTTVNAVASGLVEGMMNNAIFAEYDR